MHLQARRFPIFVSVVATPAMLERMDELAEILRPTGLRPVPKLLRGAHAGRRFPADYSRSERSEFIRQAKLARRSYAGFLGSRSEAPTINPFEDDAFVTGFPGYAGRMCDAGRRFVRINPDGNVFRCSRKTPLGSLLNGTFAPLKRREPCDTSYCYYFCEKHSLREPRVAASDDAYVASLSSSSPGHFA
jgi:hypothetical protein